MTTPISHRAAFAREVLRTALRDQHPPPLTVPGPRTGGAPLPIGIIGGGAAGLGAAMMLKSLGKPFEILEASNRVGGRCFTYHFSDTQFDYYDVGAMRFPKIPPMQPTFDMFKITGVDLLPYLFTSENTISYYNDIPYIAPPNPPVQTSDIFHVGVNEGGPVPQQIADTAPSVLMSTIFGPFGEAFAKSFDEGWAMLKPFDMLSTRAYIQQTYPEEYTQAAVTWLETTEFGTSMDNDSFTEAVLDYLEFGDPYASINPRTPTSNPWFCVNGGTQVLTDAMFSKLEIPLTSVTGKAVNKIALAPDSSSLAVSVQGEPTPRNYSHVISTMSFGCLQAVDLPTSIPYALKAAIRCCNYGESTKVGIKFSTRWWQQLPAPIKGGMSLTDRPTRTIVYPSYGVDDPTAPGTILASYTWSQDASRLGSLIQGPDTAQEKQLINMIFNDLAVLHRVSVKSLTELYVGHHAWDWCHDDFTRGAFAFFAPGQFSEFFPSITRPTVGGMLHFAGEATSVHHAWVTGALASAWRAVAEILISEGSTLAEAEAMLVTQGFSKPDEVDMELLSLQVALGSVVKDKE